jgi:hypothetical protein
VTAVTMQVALGIMKGFKVQERIAELIQRLQEPQDG